MSKPVFAFPRFGHWTRRRFHPEALAVRIEEIAPEPKAFWQRDEFYLFIMSYFAFTVAIGTFIF